MANKIGEMIGKVVHTFSTKNVNGEKCQTTLTFDFSTSSDADIKSWLARERTIAFQKPFRMLPLDEMKNANDTVVLASDAGKRVKSRAERIAELVNVGLPEEVATMAIDNPSAFAKFIETRNSN